MELFEYLKTCQETIGTIVIDEDFIKFRDESKNKFNPKGRSETVRLIHADCLITEYTLIKNGMVTKPGSIRHDFSLGDNKIDAKIITSKYFNISDDSLAWFNKNIELGELTHFAFYQYVSAPTRPFQVGDKVELRLLRVESAKTVLANKRKSVKTSGYYFAV